MWDLFTPKNPNYVPPIRPELIHMALNNGIVAEDDFLARSYNTLPDIVTEIPPTTQEPLPLDQLNSIISPSSSDFLEHGYVRLSDWTWYLACKTNLRNCTGEMFEWWFSHCDNPERHRWTHPTENIDGGEYDPTFYATQPEDRLPGHYIGHRFSGKRIINGVKHRYHIDYVNPIDYLDTSKLPAAGITACITGQLYVVDKDFGEIFLGHIVHIVKERGVGYNELITRMWLGHIDKQGGSIGFPPPSLVNYIANSTLYRFFGLSSAWARYQWIHMVQETGCIANLLPTFYPLEMKRLQFRKENFPNGLVLDEVKNHLRNLEIENPYLEYDRPGDSMSTREYEYKSNELPRPLTVYTGLEPWEVLGASDSVDAESSSTQSFRNNSTKAAPAPKISTSSASGSSQRLSNRNTSLRARQLHQKSENITNSADKEDITPSRTTQGSSSTRVYGNDQSDDDHDDEKESTSPRELQEKSGGADYDTTISSAISYSTNSLGGGVDI